MLRAEVSASTFSFFAGVVTGHENLSTPDFSRVQILTRCLRWSSITFDIEGVGKVTLALLSSPSFPFGGKRGSREKNDRWKIPKHRRLANSLTRGLVQLLHLTRGLRIISSSLVYRKIFCFGIYHRSFFHRARVIFCTSIFCRSFFLGSLSLY